LSPAPRRALLSVSDRQGVAEFASRLARAGWELVSTGGTAAHLRGAGLPVTDVSAITGLPEMLDGRVKTLHPSVHGAILARLDLESHRAAIDAAGIHPIALVVVNLYPFRETVAREDVTLEAAVENIDIGGPALIRAAAKNHPHVTVLTDPADYDRVAAQIEAGGETDAPTRFALARKAFAHTAAYDAAISGWLGRVEASGGQVPPPPDAWPAQLDLTYARIATLRYGENPHQSAAFYRDVGPSGAIAGTLAGARQRQGKALSYNNIADADAAWECVRDLGEAALDAIACVIVKHANPCGVAIGATPVLAYRRAFATDPTSAFGGIIAFSGTIDEDGARAVSGQFAEVVIAPAISPEALAVFADRPNLRVLEVGEGRARNRLSFARVGGGLLAQQADGGEEEVAAARVVTRREPDAAERRDLAFAWRVVRHVKSNAIVFVRDGQTLGIGAGQMSRIDSVRIARIKAGEAGLDLAGASVASDAFFPFRDGLDALAAAGARAVVQPGGSVRDAEVIAAADEQSVAMLFTGVRHFRH
jgi:phosphoribosylaminoimidazolecarboxamide formyltransferase/IMP cyclohydrolase